MLQQTVHEGHWLVFNNCHLLEQWDKEVMAHLCRLVSPERRKWAIKNQIFDDITDFQAEVPTRSLYLCIFLTF